jgi:hypothetical protein
MHGKTTIKKENFFIRLIVGTLKTAELIAGLMQRRPKYRGTEE